MKRTVVLSTMMLCLTMGSAARAQQGRGADVKTIDGVMRAFYEVVSTAPGVLSDFKRDSSLHSPDAKIRFSRTGRDGSPGLQTLTLGEVHKGMSEPRSKGFHEREINRIVQQFGRVAHVWSTYVESETPGGPALERGISSVSLYYDGSRWWITDWIDEGETPSNRIPGAFLPRRGR